MNHLLNFLFLFNVLQNDCHCLPESFLNSSNATEDAPHFRIFFGTVAKEKEFPYQVSMKIRSRGTYYTFCGGTIIGPSKVLSAAHCFYNDKKSPCSCASVKQLQRSLTDMYAVAGTLMNRQSKKNDGNNQWRQIMRTVAPHDYSFPRRDIAIVFTSKPYIYNDYVNQIPYAQSRRTYKGVHCVASGYGQTETKPSEVLLWAKLEVMSTAKCSRLHNNNMRRFVCTEGAITDVGKGDSGGPLVCKNTGHSNEGDKGILVGVTSGKRESKRKRKGSSGGSNNAFFTRVSFYEKFIKNNKALIIVPDFTLRISGFSFVINYFRYNLNMDINLFHLW